MALPAAPLSPRRPCRASRHPARYRTRPRPSVALPAAVVVKWSARCALVALVLLAGVGWVGIGRTSTLVDRSADVVANTAHTTGQVASTVGGLSGDVEGVAHNVTSSIDNLQSLASSSGTVVSDAADLTESSLPETLERASGIAGDLAQSADQLDRILAVLGQVPTATVGQQLRDVHLQLANVPTNLRSSAEALRTGGTALAGLSTTLGDTRVRLDAVAGQLAEVAHVAEDVASSAGSIHDDARTIQGSADGDQWWWRAGLLSAVVAAGALALSIERLASTLERPSA